MEPFLSFSDLLVQKKILPEEVVRRVQREAESARVSFEEQLIAKKLLDDEKIAKIKAEYSGLPLKDLSEVVIDKQMVEMIPQDVAEHYKVIAFGKEGAQLLVGIVDPQDFQAVEAVEFLAKDHRLAAKFFVITRKNFLSSLKKYRMLGKEVKTVVEEAQEQMKAPEKTMTQEEKKMEEVIRSAPVSKIASMILRFAVENKASDIHIEPLSEEKTRVRYRIDGEMRTSLVLPGSLHAALVSRIKVLSNMKLDETRIPQDGRIKFEVEGTAVDLRVSTLPLLGREKVVMRVLDSSGGVPALSALGFRPMYVRIMERSIAKPHGMFLITGPTGSGKSTTLYAALNSVNVESVNIVTLEDPVEYHIAGINQSQVNHDVGFSFASGLRSILRQDPDVIMVGEIRDQETGSLAVQAGLTGHLVFSTLHTNDAFGAIPRLIDMSIQPFLLVSTLNLVMAQRLVRTLCERCKEPTELPANILQEIEATLKEIPEEILKDQFPAGSVQPTPFRAKGCPRCGDKGYKGRTTVAEFIEMTLELQKIVTEGNDPDKVREEVKRQGMIKMRHDGILKVAAGITTMEEVIAATGGLGEE